VIILRIIENFNLKSRRSFLFILFPVAMVYFECIFRLSTQGTFLTIATIPMLLFSASLGWLLYIISNLFKNPKINYVITAVLLGGCAVLYLVEYFVYRQFKVFYDLNTVTGGAGDMMGGFLGRVFALIFSLDGIFKILLFFLPMALYLIFARKPFISVFDKKKFYLIALVLVLALYGAGVGLVYLIPSCRAVYSEEYNYQDAVEQFGLMTANRLDAKNMIFGSNGAFEEFVDTSVSVVESENSQSEEESSVESQIVSEESKIESAESKIESETASKDESKT
jgi:lipoteichoic acid synthase